MKGVRKKAHMHDFLPFFFASPGNFIKSQFRESLPAWGFYTIIQFSCPCNYVCF